MCMYMYMYMYWYTYTYIQAPWRTCRSGDGPPWCDLCWRVTNYNIETTYKIIKHSSTQTHSNNTTIIRRVAEDKREGRVQHDEERYAPARQPRADGPQQ